ncbi:MAG: malonyl-ACP O-methyltransferase BioC [Pseudomonas sp.]
MAEALPDKRLIAESFSRAATTYDHAAALQRSVGNNLLARLPAKLTPMHIIDLGCGTGYFSRALASRYRQPVLGLDLAEGMLRHARGLGDELAGWVAADAEALPVRSQSQDLVFSSLALQWCPQLQRALAEAWRVLRPGGCLAFNTLLDGSLYELREAWRAVDDLIHVNRFMPLAELESLLGAAGFSDWSCEVEQPVLHYPQLIELTRELKALGAHNINPGRPAGLTGRAGLRTLTAAYDHFRTEQGLPASWQVAQILMFKGTDSSGEPV